MKKTKVVASLLALMLTLSAFGALSPGLMAAADSHEDEVEDGMEDTDSDDNSGDTSDDSNDDDSSGPGGEREDRNRGILESRERSKVAVEDDGLEIELRLKGLDLDDGTYNTTLECATPAIDMDLEDSLEVEGGEGQLETRVDLDVGVYTDCDLSIQDTEIVIDVGSFAITGEDDAQAQERRQDRMKKTVENHDAEEIHERHRGAAAASPGEYEPGAEYVLSMLGSADDGNVVQDASVDVDLGVWKSVRSLVLFDVLGGTVTVGDTEYTVQLGYAIYSNSGDVLRLRALATDDSTGEIVGLSLRGEAVEETDLPKESGASVDLIFDGNSGVFKNEIDGWELSVGGFAEAT